MATVISFERADEIEHGISGGSDEREVSYWAKLDAPVAGENDDAGDVAVLDYAESHVPTAWDGLPRAGFTLEQVTPNTFLVTAKFSAVERQSQREAAAVATTQWEFEISAETQRRYLAVSQQRFGAKAPEHGLYINVRDENGVLRVDGVDAFLPRRIYRIRKTFPYTAFTDTYINTIEGLVGKMNNATYKGVPAKELLFLGTRGSIASSGESEISFEFWRKRPPALPITIPGGAGESDIVIPTGTDISGFDIIWAAMREGVGAVNDMEAGAKGVYVSRIVELGNFSLLGL